MSDNGDYVAFYTSLTIRLNVPSLHEAIFMKRRQGPKGWRRGRQIAMHSVIGRVGIAFLKVVQKAVDLLHARSVYLGVGTL